MRRSDAIRNAYEKIIVSRPYEFCHYKQFDYDILKYIYYLNTAGQGIKTSYNDVIIMVDTETSKKRPDETYMEGGRVKWKTGDNHVVAWTISIRAFHHNIVTLYGRKPSKLAETMLRIHEHMAGLKTVMFVHNLAYDHIFCRKFWYKLYGVPKMQLNVKSYYPILIEFDNGIILKDSLILAQRKLEKWASDLDVEHKKEVGAWDYDVIRNQNTPLSEDEKRYIEHDTLAGVECIDKTMEALNKLIYSLPLTATGIPREQTRKRGKVVKAHNFFLKIAPTYEQYLKLLQCFHGGYTHGNRHFINMLIDWAPVRCRDFASSYPYIMCAFKFPMERFTPVENCDVSFILDQMDDYAFMFKFIATNIELKTDDEPMPALQFSKAVKTINAILDNGRILAANYVEIYLTEYDLAVIAQQYKWDKHVCCEVETAEKDYLPRWFTDYVFEAYTSKTMLKGGDKTSYSIAKALVNSLYGMCVQRSIRPDIIEDYMSGEFVEEELVNPEERYKEYTEKLSSILCYTHGVWVTSAAFYNVHRLAKCCRVPLYMDTDSCYGIDWDEKKVEAYNNECKQRLTDNGYGAVIRGDREYWLGVAETDEDNDLYSEFKYMGAKRYCGRCVADGELHLTVAGVPKVNGATCLENDIGNFHPGFIFSGTKTGKKTHCYFNVEDIYIDKNGNETGDSISLIPCDYELDAVGFVDWESIFNREVEVQIYDED